MNVSTLMSRKPVVKSNVERINDDWLEYSKELAKFWGLARKHSLICEEHQCSLDYAHWGEWVCGMCFSNDETKEFKAF